MFRKQCLCFWVQLLFDNKSFDYIIICICVDVADRYYLRKAFKFLHFKDIFFFKAINSYFKMMFSFLRKDFIIQSQFEREKNYFFIFQTKMNSFAKARKSFKDKFSIEFFVNRTSYFSKPEKNKIDWNWNWIACMWFIVLLWFAGYSCERIFLTGNK